MENGTDRVSSITSTVRTEPCCRPLRTLQRADSATLMEHANGSITAILIGVWATFALDVFSTLNSSPQTTELFADERQESLMHWVAIGTAVGIGGGAIATVLSGKPWPLVA